MRLLGYDLMALGGCAAFLYGVREVYPPAAWMVGGLAAVAVAVLLARKGRS